MAIPAFAAKLGIPIIGNLISKILDKVAKDKVDDATMAQIKNEALQALRDDGQEDIAQFYGFMLDYEGRAEDHGPLIKTLRGSVRPVITYANFVFLVYIGLSWMMGWSSPGANVELVLKLIFGLNGLTLGFWFGERALKYTGMGQLFRDKVSNTGSVSTTGP